MNRNEQFERENPINGRQPSESDHERSNDVSAADNLDNIDENLKSIENHIIDDTIKYTGSKQGKQHLHLHGGNKRPHETNDSLHLSIPSLRRHHRFR